MTFSTSDAFDASPFSPWKTLAQKGTKNSSGIYSYDDPETKSSYYYNPLSGSTKRTYESSSTSSNQGESSSGFVAPSDFVGFGPDGKWYQPNDGRSYIQGGNKETDYANYLKRKQENTGTGTGTGGNSGGLFGNTGGYLGTGVSFNDYVNKMKELTDWRLGIDKRSMENAYGFRNQEANRDFGFNTQLAGQQIQGQKDIQAQQIEGTKNLETLRNEYMNTRQREQLENQRNMQQAGFNQQNKLLTDNANRARSLYFGGR